MSIGPGTLGAGFMDLPKCHELLFFFNLMACLRSHKQPLLFAVHRSVCKMVHKDQVSNWSQFQPISNNKTSTVFFSRGGCDGFSGPQTWWELLLLTVLERRRMWTVARRVQESSVFFCLQKSSVKVIWIAWRWIGWSLRQLFFLQPWLAA